MWNHRVLLLKRPAVDCNLNYEARLAGAAAIHVLFTREKSWLLPSLCLFLSNELSHEEQFVRRVKLFIANHWDLTNTCSSNQTRVLSLMYC